MSKILKSYSNRSLLALLKREVYHPSYTLKGYTFRYTSAILLTSSLFLLSIIFKSESMSSLLLVLAVVGTAWVGGLGAALFASFLGVIFLYSLFFYPHGPTITFLLESIILILTATISGLSIYYSKRIDQLVRFNEKVKEFEKKAILMEAENEKLRNEIRARDEFLSIASHELKTPLTATLLKLQIALHNIRNTSLANFSVQNLMDMLLSSEQQTQRLAKMIGDLLNVSLMSTGRMELDKEKADLSQITKDVIKGLIEKAKKENIDIRLESTGPVPGKFDKMRIEQVLINLMTNAMKYGNQKPIEVKVEKTNSLGRVTITDYGIGIPAKQKEKIFELFERGVRDGQKNGLGVGLYITNQIVKAHKGKLNLDSKEGKGSTFCLEIPLN
jgi:signal transduction histidine kinase